MQLVPPIPAKPGNRSTRVFSLGDKETRPTDIRGPREDISREEKSRPVSSYQAPKKSTCRYRAMPPASQPQKICDITSPYFGSALLAKMMRMDVLGLVSNGSRPEKKLLQVPGKATGVPTPP